MSVDPDGRLAGSQQYDLQNGDHIVEARLDLGRETRKGVPEVIFAEGKTDEQVIDIVRVFVQRTGHAIVSRMSAELLGHLERDFPEYSVDIRKPARAAAIRAHGYQIPRTGGRIAVLTAGTSDISVAEEARLVAEEMGVETETLYDVGVAGLHRLIGPLGAILERGVSAIVVCAGMDGALPSVVAGLVPVPVIGIPVPSGYGAGGQGKAALLSMLQTCAPGLAVVNIGNGVGGGAMAALIANRVAEVERRLADQPLNP